MQKDQFYYLYDTHYHIIKQPSLRVQLNLASLELKISGLKHIPLTSYLF